MRRFAVWCGIFVVAQGLRCGMGAAQQKSVEPPPPMPPIEMPADREADSYAIYSQLLPHSLVEGADWKRSLWLVEAVTVATVQRDKPCDPGRAEDTGGFMANPHFAVQAPRERELEWRQVLADFDAHCHERVMLKASSIEAGYPVHLVDEAAQQRFQKTRFMPKDKLANGDPHEFDGATGLHSFSEVYFSQDHRLALLHTGMWCGGLCGMWEWVVLEHVDGKWKPLPWVRTFTIS